MNQRLLAVAYTVISIVWIYSPTSMAQTTFEVIDAQARSEAQQGTSFAPPDVPPLGSFSLLDEADFKQCNAVSLSTFLNNWLDGQGWFAAQRPRCGVPINKVDLFRKLAPFTVEGLPPCDSSLFKWGGWVDPIAIPSTYRYCKGFTMGHEITGEGFPELAAHTADGFWRLTRPPSLTVFDGSFRMLAENIFAGGTEPVPCTRRIGEITTCTSVAYGEIVDSTQLNIVFRVDNQDIAGTLNMVYTFFTDAEGEGVNIAGEARFYPRRALNLSEVTLSVVAHSTMFFQGDDFPSDEAHDADTVRLVKPDGQQLIRRLRNPSPSDGLQREVLGVLEVNDRIDILQVDRDPTHYRQIPDEPLRFEDRASFRITVLDSNKLLDLVLYEQYAPNDCCENIAIAANIRSSEGILSQGELISIRYKVEAFRGIPAPPLTTATIFRVQRDGTVFTDRSFNCGLPSNCFNVGQGADIAERIQVSEPVEPGDVVEIDPDRPRYYRRTQEPYSSSVVGVISSTPAFTLANRPEDSNLALTSSENSMLFQKILLSHLMQRNVDDSPRWTIGALLLSNHESRTRIAWLAEHLENSRRLTAQPLLALVGRVYAKATTENGPIQPGDLLVSASLAGYVMRCLHPQACEGTLIGKALEPLVEGTGLILMLVMR